MNYPFKAGVHKHVPGASPTLHILHFSFLWHTHFRSWSCYNELMSWIRCDKGDIQNVQCWGGSRNEFGNPCFKVWGWFQTQPRSPDSLETFRQVRLSSLQLNSAGHWPSRSRIGHALSILFRPALKHTIQVRGRQRRSKSAVVLLSLAPTVKKTSPACSPSNSEDLD